MTTESLKDTIKCELPEWLRQDPDFRAYVMELTRQADAPRTRLKTVLRAARRAAS